MPRPFTAIPMSSAPLDLLDRAAIAYLVLPLPIFLLGWFELWVAVPLVACLAYALRPLADFGRRASDHPVSRVQLLVAIGVGCVWTFYGGTAHWVFANPDWHVRDAVLHDLVEFKWPVGYGLPADPVTLLRAPLAYYLPAALTGKLLGLQAAHIGMAAWTALGAVLFLIQVLSLAPSRLYAACGVAAVVVSFSGLDIVASLLNGGPGFIAHWRITSHLEWWQGNYQYSSMTTQLFWVPNHAIGGWLLVGLMQRHRRVGELDELLPMLIIALALWSPLTTIGILPFVLCRVYEEVRLGRGGRVSSPRRWLPACLVGLIVAAYLSLDSGRIPKGLADLHGGIGGVDGLGIALLQQIQFFVWEAGLVGLALLWMGRFPQLLPALAILAILPVVHFGPANDLVMRASIPSLAVLAICASLALFGDVARAATLRQKLVLGGLLALGAVTPIEEFARAALLPTWPVNLNTNVIGANCGGYPPHYVGQIGQQWIGKVLRPVQPVPVGRITAADCANPAVHLMWPDGPE